jgi:hypothetical protein
MFVFLLLKLTSIAIDSDLVVIQLNKQSCTASKE